MEINWFGVGLLALIAIAIMALTIAVLRLVHGGGRTDVACAAGCCIIIAAVASLQLPAVYERVLPGACISPFTIEVPVWPDPPPGSGSCP